MLLAFAGANTFGGVALTTTATKLTTSLTTRRRSLVAAAAELLTLDGGVDRQRLQ